MMEKMLFISLAQLHIQELAKSKKEKKINKRNVQESLIKSKFYINLQYFILKNSYLKKFYF
jgi:hypothetical protein